jgi:hypothetical protein
MERNDLYKNLKIERDVEIKLPDIDPAEGITDMRDLFPAPGESMEDFIKRINMQRQPD